MSLVFNMVGGGSGGGIKLASIAITTPPAKTTYTAGETFDPAGMVVEATYSNGAKAVATGYSYTPSTALTDGITTVTIQYTEGGITKTAEQAITVVHRLEGIAITTQPSKTVYEYGDSFASAGMVVTATYSDGATAAVTGYTTSPSTLSKVGEQTVTVSYTERGVTKTTTLSVMVERKSIAIVPSQRGTLTYTGSAQSPIWSNYNAEQMTIGGVTSGTNAGSYNATFTPTANYRWSDGSITAKSVSWTIGKAAGSLSISPTSLTLDSSNPTGTINVTRAGNGKISAESSNTSVATVSVSGTQVTVNNVNQTSGSAVITISVSEGTNHTAPGSKTCEITAAFVFVSSVLNDNDWATIRQVSDNGQGANYWAVGDTKTITINGTVGTLSLSNLSVDVFILGFDHNSSVEGSNRIHFQIGKIGSKLIGLCDSKYNSYAKDGTKDFNMNHGGNYNYGGWAGCDLRYDVLCSTDVAPSGYGSAVSKSRVGYNASATCATNPVANTLMAALPADLRAVMKGVTKYADAVGNSSNVLANVKAFTDYLFLLAEFEVQGTRSYANKYEQNYQKQYAYYSSGNSKVMYKHNGTATAAYWWLRSASYYNYDVFCITYVDGSAFSGNANYAYALAPGFAV